MKDIESMTNKELFDYVEEYIANKIAQNEKIVRYSYYELSVKLNLNEKELDRFLRCSKIVLEELHYKVFFTGAKFVYDNANRVVETNEHMIAVKEDENEFSK